MKREGRRGKGADNGTEMGAHVTLLANAHGLYHSNWIYGIYTLLNTATTRASHSHCNVIHKLLLQHNQIIINTSSVHLQDPSFLPPYQF